MTKADKYRMLLSLFTTVFCAAVGVLNFALSREWYWWMSMFLLATINGCFAYLNWRNR